MKFVSICMQFECNLLAHKSHLTLLFVAKNDGRSSNKSGPLQVESATNFVCRPQSTIQMPMANLRPTQTTIIMINIQLVFNQRESIIFQIIKRLLAAIIGLCGKKLLARPFVCFCHHDNNDNNNHN